MTKKIIDVSPVEEVVKKNNKQFVLVLGKGYVGSNLSDFLAQDVDGLEVHSVSRDQLNYADKDELYNFLVEYQNQGIKFDVIVNAVGYTGETNVDDAETNKELCFLLNTVFPITLAATIQKYNDNFKEDVVTRVINISSGCIFDGKPKDKEEWDELDVPNFGMFDENSSFYSKSKHASELMTSMSFDNVINLRVRMPISDINSKRNLLNKILNYKTLLNHKNSITYIYDLFNYIYNIVINKDFVSGIYNIVSDGVFEPELLLKVLKNNKKELIEKKVISKDHFDKVTLVNLKEFYKKDLTKAARSNIIMSNKNASNVINYKFNKINEKFLDQIVKNYINNL